VDCKLHSGRTTSQVHQACDFVVNSSPDRKPVHLTQNMRDVIHGPLYNGAIDEPCGSVLESGSTEAAA